VTGVEDAQSGIAAVYLRVLATPGGPLHPDPLLVSGAPAAGVLESSVVVPRLPHRIPLVVQVTVVNGAGATATATSRTVALGATVPVLSTFRVPTQPLPIAPDGSLTLRVEWAPPAASSGSTISCCDYTLFASTSPSRDGGAFSHSVVAASVTAVSVGSARGLVSYELRLPSVSPGRLFLWLKASNTARLSTTVRGRAGPRGPAAA
jgi:hypothetical protein